MRLSVLMLMCACSCPSGGDRDASIDAAVGDGSVDGSSDGSLDATSDAGIDRLMGPGDMEPPDTALEPGSGADDAYRYCWYMAGIICQGIYGCCPFAMDTIGNDQDECNMQMRESACNVYLERPDAFGPQDRDALEENLTVLEAAAAACVPELTTVKFVYLFGDLDIGEDCSAESTNPHFLCREGLPCVDGVCSAIPGIGETCGGGIGPNCDSSEAYCGAGELCIAWGDAINGADCTRNTECASRLCQDDVCVSLSEGNLWCFGQEPAT